MASESVSRFPDRRVHELRARVAAMGCRLEVAGGDVRVLDPDRGSLLMEIGDVERWCDGRTAAAGHVPTDAAAWLTGADVAIDLLEEGAELGLSEMALQDECRQGRPQANVFLKHLKRLRALNNSTSDAAFSAVMTEYVGLYADSLTMQLFIDESRKPIATTEEYSNGRQ